MQQFMLSERAGEHRRRGEFEEARLVCEAALALAEREGSTRLQNQIEQMLAGILARLGQVDAARDRYRSVIAHAERAGDLHLAIQARSNFARMLMDEEDPAAEAALLETLADAERLSLPGNRASVRVNLGILYHRRGELDRAEACLLSCLDMSQPRQRQMALGFLALIAIERGDPARAREWMADLEPTTRWSNGVPMREDLEERLARTPRPLRGRAQ
jgi:Flp pilus assembly protein TadD